jgi:hypothetical protein
LIILFIVAKAAAVMLLWNALVPDLFHGPSLLYPQALGLMVLAKLLVGFGGFGCHHRRGHWGHGGRHAFWSKLSDEEREKFKAKLRERLDE